MGAAVHAPPCPVGHQDVCAELGQPEQAGAADSRHSGNQAEHLRTAEAVGVGARAGPHLPTEHQGAGTGPVSGVRGHAHQRGEEPGGDGTGGHVRAAGRHDAGHDDVGAVHHRQPERPRQPAGGVHPPLSGRPPQHGAPAGGLREGGRGGTGTAAHRRGQP